MNLKNIIETTVDSIKDGLKLGSKTIVGIDIGLSCVKVAELKASGDNFKLIGYASIALPEGALIEDEIQKPDDIVTAIEKGVSKIKTTATNACIAVSGQNTIARKLQLAGGSFDEIEDQVSWESEQYLPFPIEDSSLSFHVFGQNEGGGVDVLVAAARLDIVENYKELVERSKLKVRIVDLGLVAITNVFEHVYKDKLNNPNISWVLIDVGAQKTEFIIYRQGGIAFTKEMNVGGAMITEEIQRQMGVNYEEAEDLKITGDENGNLPEEILEIVEDILENFFAEIKKTIDFYISSTSDESISECVLTGGGALIPGLVEGLEALIGVGVSILNPFDRFDFDKKKFSDEEINDIAFRGGVALGLAMRQKY